MHEKKPWKYITCSLLAMTLTVSCYLLDQYSSERQATDAALQWARQIFGQTESMQLSAQMNGEKDPLTWAVNYLAQGVEPRVMKISRVTASPEFLRSGTLETYQLNRKTGIFDYLHLFHQTDGQENGSSVRITLDLQTAGIIRGFLGTRTRITEDLALAIVFFVFLYFSWKTLTYSRRKAEMEKIKVTQEPAPAPSQSTIQPTPELKHSVGALGVEIRELVKQAYSIVVASKESQKVTESIKERIRAGLNQLHANRKLLKEATTLVTRAESMTNNVGQELDQTVLLSLLEKIKEVSVRNERIFRELELQIEPCLTDVDLASDTFMNSMTATEKMNEQIQKTKEKLIAHVRTLQSQQSSSNDNAA
jgi:hypothetical protein